MNRKLASSADTEKDDYFIRAVKEGYRARSAYKLLQLARCFDLFEGVKSVVDLCAAPGSWSQVISNRLHGLNNFRDHDSIELCPDVKIVAIDLDTMQNIPGVIQLTADITKLSTCEEIMRLFEGERVDLIVCDGSHDVSGLEIMDFHLHLGLITACIHIFLQTLKEGGSFVAKMFDTWGCEIFIKQLQLFFREVNAVKPHSSRDESDEFFAVCRGFKMPHGFDPNELTPYLDYSYNDFSKLTGIHKSYIPFLVTGFEELEDIKLGEISEDNGEAKNHHPVNMFNNFGVTDRLYEETANHLRRIYKLGHPKHKNFSTKPLIVWLDENDMANFFSDLEESYKADQKEQLWKEFVEKMEKEGKPLFKNTGHVEPKDLTEEVQKLSTKDSDELVLPVQEICSTPKCSYCVEHPKKNNISKENSSSCNPELLKQITSQATSSEQSGELLTDGKESRYTDFTLRSRLDNLFDEQIAVLNNSTGSTVNIDRDKFLVLEDPNSATLKLVKERKQLYDELCELMKTVDCDPAAPL